MELDPGVATERGLRLILVLAFVYPSHFLYNDIMKELLILIKEDVDNVAAFVLQIFTFIGKIIIKVLSQFNSVLLFCISFA